MATQSSAPPRIPLAAGIEARLETPSDARVINGFVEKTAEGLMVVKRPAIQLYQTLPAGGTHGCYWWNNHIYAIANNNLYKDGVLVGAVSNSGGFSFASTLGATPKLVFHNNANTYTYDGTTLATVTPGQTFYQGFAYLDGTLYGLASPSGIYGSGINDPTTWNALNVINAVQEPDWGTAIFKQLQYVIVFKNWTIEAFWDAGNPTGSPLQSAPGTLIPFGTQQPGSIQQFEDTLIWASATRSGSIGVMMMENLKPQTISTPDIERLLQDADWTTIYSWSGRISGHRFYCLTIVNNNISLVYDLTTQMWYQWTYNGNYLPFMFCTSLPTRQVILQHENGSLYTLSQTAFTDAGVDVPVDIYTPSWDGQTRKRKVLKRLDFISDQAGMKTLQMRWSDDDYQHWSNYRNIDLSQTRPYTEDLGTFTKRAFHLHYNQPTAFRIKALECSNLMLGSGS